jgi:D-ribose pyranose/furanose isomerase RbsD
MGLFDFLKKKELKEIQELKSDLTSCNQLRTQKEKDLEKYSSIIDLEKEKKAIISEIAQEQTKLIKLNQKYIDGINVYNNLKNDISIFENNLELSEFGVYEPIYDFEKSDDYRIEQNKIIELQKSMIKDATAAICRTNWTVDGSLSKGKASTNRFIKLILRAFNGEADSLIAKVKWNNVNQIKERLNKAFETLNKLGESQTVEISHKYFKLKMQELILEYEYKAKKQQEKEELRALQEELREEEKAKREFEKAQKEAEKEEAYYLKVSRPTIS